MFCRIPGMCEDDIVARTVLVAAARSGGTGETEFEDHVGGYVDVIRVCHPCAMGNGSMYLPVAVLLLQFAAARRFLEMPAGLGFRSCDQGTALTRLWGSDGALETPAGT